MVTIDNFIEIHKDHIRVREATKQGYAIGVGGGDSINFEQPNSKTRRGRIGIQICNTLTCSCNQGVIIDMNENKPILVGGIGEINFGKQFRQGNRVYDSENTAMCLMSQPVGNAGGYSYLYKVQNKINNEGGNKIMKEFTNSFTKYNFKDDFKISIVDFFSGIGSLHQSLKELGVNTSIEGISEIDVDAIISYAGIHIDNFKDLEFDYPSENDMRNWLLNRNIGWSFEKNKSSIPRLKKDKLYKVYKASVLLNNLGDISKINPSDIPDFDLMNFSFSCTDLSGAGKQKGMKNEDGTPTRSGLYIYGQKIIKAKKPKYIMIENVKALIQKKFIDDFNDIVNEIESYGYKCYYPKKENGQATCLNAKNYGIAQNRERIFVICVRNDVDDGLFNFPEGFDSGLRLKDFLEDTVDEKWYLSQEYNDRFTASLDNEELQNKIPHSGVMEALGTTQPIDAQGTNCRHWVHNTEKLVGALSATDYKQPKQILDTNNTTLEIDDKYYLDKTKEFFIKNSFNMEKKGNGFRFEPHVKNNANISKTITTRAGARMDDNFILDNIDVDEEKFKFDSKNKYIKDTENINPNDFRIRKLTPKECFRLMGFRDECFDRAKELGTSDSGLYKQAGNSIVVNCLYYIFKELFKKYIVE